MLLQPVCLMFAGSQLTKQVEKSRKEVAFLDERAQTIATQLTCEHSTAVCLRLLHPACSNRASAGNLANEEAVKDRWRAERDELDSKIVHRKANLQKRLNELQVQLNEVDARHTFEVQEEWRYRVELKSLETDEKKLTDQLAEQTALLKQVNAGRTRCECHPSSWNYRSIRKNARSRTLARRCRPTFARAALSRTTIAPKSRGSIRFASTAWQHSSLSRWCCRLSAQLFSIHESRTQNQAGELSVRLAVNFSSVLDIDRTRQSSGGDQRAAESASRESS